MPPNCRASGLSPCSCSSIIPIYVFTGPSDIGQHVWPSARFVRRGGSRSDSHGPLRCDWREPRRNQQWLRRIYGHQSSSRHLRGHGREQGIPNSQEGRRGAFRWRRLNAGEFSLGVSASGGEVTVNADAAELQLQSNSGERSDTITSKQLNDVALNGRNVLDYMKLVPGVAVSLTVTRPARAETTPSTSTAHEPTNTNTPSTARRTSTPATTAEPTSPSTPTLSRK